jgi:hypothetical protein
MHSTAVPGQTLPHWPVKSHGVPAGAASASSQSLTVVRGVSGQPVIERTSEKRPIEIEREVMPVA